MFVSVLAQDFHSVETGKEKVENDQFWILVFAEFQTLSAVSCFGYYIHTRDGSRHTSEEVSQHDLVFDYNYAC